MRRPKVFPQFHRRYFRTEFSHCLACGTHLRAYATLSQRTVITLQGPLRVTHVGYRCPNPVCLAPGRSYRSAAADALALPGFTFGLDLLVQAGQLHWGAALALDAVHAHLTARLAPYALTISRREVLYLLDHYATLVRAAQHPASDPTWAAWCRQVHTQGGLILSIDGIQPDQGQETVYLVRDVLTRRVLAAENLRSSSRAAIEGLLAPVVALGLPVQAVITDGQDVLRDVVAELWPQAAHQLCQYHFLREAGEPSFNADRALKVALRKAIAPPVGELRNQLHKDQAALAESAPQEREQLAVLDSYARGVQTALHQEGKPPFDYAGLAADAALASVEASLGELEKGGLVAAR
jgi:hypothetical protein